MLAIGIEIEIETARANTEVAQPGGTREGAHHPRHALATGVQLIRHTATDIPATHY
jgi:hypothetical protein